MRYRPLVAFLALSLLWGSDWVLRASSPPQPPLRSLAIQYAISAAILLPWAVHQSFWRRPARSIVNAIIVGIGILCLPQLLIFVVKDRLSPVLCIAFLATVPVLLAISGRVSITTAVGGLAGVLFLLDRGLDFPIHSLLWLLLPLTATGLVALALIGAEKHMQTMSTVEALFGQCAASALLLFIASQILERETITWSATAAMGFAINAALVTVGGYLLFYWLLGKFGAGRVSMLQWTQPLIVTLESMLVMRGRPGWTMITGATLIVIAIMWAFSNRDDDRGVIFEITRS
jgi:drug/metabolite transporter (DMT)-like permease